MTKFILFLFLCFLFAEKPLAQTTGDSSIAVLDTGLKSKPIIVKKKAIKQAKDSLKTKHLDSLAVPVPKLPQFADSHISLFRDALSQNPDFNFLGKIVSEEAQVHLPVQMDGLFYLLLGICFYFALLRLFFYKYLNSLLALFFRASMRQQQIRDQAQQMPLASLLFNILFVITAGMYASFVAHYEHFVLGTNIWLLMLYCTLLIGGIYLVKFCVLKISGWVFNINKAADSYIFSVFMVNKIAAIALLPIIVLISFCGPLVAGIAITMSFFLLLILLIYRFVACFTALRTEIRLSLFHYFIYLCAFEIAPLLLIYKVALSYLKKGY